MSRFWSPIINQLAPYVPGEQPKNDRSLIKLNTNENPYPPSDKVIDAIRSTAELGLQKYPDPNGQHLKNAIADYHQLDEKQVFVGNSSDEVLAHVFLGLFSGKTNQAEA